MTIVYIDSGKSKVHEDTMEQDSNMEHDASMEGANISRPLQVN